MTLGTTCTGSRRCGCVGCYDARYAAGYAACRETMTPAVLATEDAYLLGHEAGRLAAIRAEVERHVRQLEAFIEAAESRAVLFDVALYAATTRAGMDLEVDYRHGSGHDARVMLADCRRWLQETA